MCVLPHLYLVSGRFLHLMSALGHKTAITSPPLRGERLKILFVNDTSLQTHHKVCVVNIVNSHNVSNEPNDLGYMYTARTLSSVSYWSSPCLHLVFLLIHFVFRRQLYLMQILCSHNQNCEIKKLPCFLCGLCWLFDITKLCILRAKLSDSKFCFLQLASV